MPTENKPDHPAATVQGQQQIFQQAMGLFHKRQLEEAKDLFEQAAHGPALEISHTARTYAQMCATRLEQGRQAKTAEEHYTLGVAMINQRRLSDAERHLQEAVRIAPNADQMYYGLALVSALKGDPSRAAEHLKKAIAIQPQNRVAAINDPDFAVVAQQSPLRELLHPPGH